MKLKGVEVRQKGKGMSCETFKAMVSIFDKFNCDIKNPKLHEALSAEKSLSKHFKATPQQLQRKHLLTVTGRLKNRIKLDSRYDIDLPAIVHGKVIQDIEAYMNKLVFSSVKSALRYSEHLPEISKDLDKILEKLENGSEGSG